MKRVLAAAALAASFALTTVSTAVASAPMDRYQYVRAPGKRIVLSVTKSGSTWFTGTDAGGKKMTVVFLKDFDTVVRHGSRVPVSELRPGDRVAVMGQVTGQRIYASSGRVIR
jgi:uncharacterized cupredoxin-like copper-binding protein